MSATEGFKLVCDQCTAKEFAYGERHFASINKLGHHIGSDPKKPRCSGVFIRATTEGDD